MSPHIFIDSAMANPIRIARFSSDTRECQEKYEALQMPNKLSLLIDETDRMMQVERIRMIRDLRTNQRKLEQDTLSVAELLPEFVIKYQDLEMTIEAYEQVNELNKTLDNLKTQQETYARHEKVFNFDQGPCRILGKLIDDFRPLYMLWTLAREWYDNNALWLEQRFAAVRPDQMNSFMLAAGKRIAKLKKDLLNYQTLLDKVLKPLGDQIERFKRDMPLITKLRHPGIKTKHWEEISQVVGFSVMPSTELTLQELLQMDLGR
jgi:hypothetical protein